MDVVPAYVGRVLECFGKLKKTSNGWEGHCPAHEDRKASLCLSIGEAGRILVHCQAGCSSESVVQRVGLSMTDLFAPTEKGRIVATYDYRNEAEEIVFQKVRYESKKFSQRRPDGAGGWIDNLEGVETTLYRLPELLSAPEDEAVYVVEGEKDADNLAALGLIATTNPGGAGKWKDRFSHWLSGRKVIIIPDNDKPGKEHAEHVRASLDGYAETIKTILLPGLQSKGDVSDWIKQGGTKEQLIELVARPDIEPSRNGHCRSETTKEIPWPDKIKEDAYFGIAGEIVRRIEPETEADPVAILIQFLVAFGNLVGRGPHFQVERTKHYLNLFLVLVGRTSRGRKGTAMGWVEDILYHAGDSQWASKMGASGLSSGEGLIWEVRDPIEKVEIDKKSGERRIVLVDEGETEKRRLIVEQEFSSVLTVAGRDGNIISTIIRQAWDNGRLRIMTKNNKAKATDAHISIIGHVTKNELLKKMKEVEVANGFANRFLWSCVLQSKLLPFGGGSVDLNDLIAALMKLVEFAKTVGRIGRDDEANSIWKDAYAKLNEERGGSFGMVTDRAGPQVLRISCIYALLDASPVVRAEHLRAALAVWSYCEASCKYIFGDSCGHGDSDEIEDALLQVGSKGLSRTEISSSVFHRNKSSRNITLALNHLRDLKLAVCRREKDQNGKQSERWFSCVNGYELTNCTN